MDTEIKSSLEALGITPRNYRVLMLLPLVYVAWADNRMDDVEIAVIDEIAKDRFLLDMKGLEVLDRWLNAPIPREIFDEAMLTLFLMAQTETGEPLVHAEDLHELLLHAEAVARATAKSLDSPTNVSSEEEAALAEIAGMLHIDNGVSWRRLLDELDAGPASVAAGRMPRSRRAR